MLALSIRMSAIACINSSSLKSSSEPPSTVNSLGTSAATILRQSAGLVLRAPSVDFAAVRCFLRDGLLAAFYRVAEQSESTCPRRLIGDSGQGCMIVRGEHDH
jgi:hypothetical protein